MSKRFKARRGGFGTNFPFGDDQASLFPKTSYTQQDFQTRVGQWINFDTKWGNLRGMIEEVRGDAVLLKLPEEYADSAFINQLRLTSGGDDVILTGYGDCHHHDCHHRDCHHGDCHHHAKPYPWFWCWVPFIFIIFIVPFWW